MISFLLIAGGFYLLLAGLDRVLRPIPGLKEYFSDPYFDMNLANIEVAKIVPKITIKHTAVREDHFVTIDDPRQCNPQTVHRKEESQGIIGRAGVSPVWWMTR